MSLAYARAGLLGVLTPQGQQFVMDDNVTNQFIRLRTKSGAQILLHDNTGCIYIISRDGNNWIEMDADGHLDVFAASDISTIVIYFYINIF